MQVNPENGPPEIYVTWSDPRMTDFENYMLFLGSGTDTGDISYVKNVTLLK